MLFLLHVVPRFPRSVDRVLGCIASATGNRTRHNGERKVGKKEEERKIMRHTQGIVGPRDQVMRNHDFSMSPLVSPCLPNSTSRPLPLLYDFSFLSAFCSGTRLPPACRNDRCSTLLFFPFMSAFNSKQTHGIPHTDLLLLPPSPSSASSISVS